MSELLFLVPLGVLVAGHLATTGLFLRRVHGSEPRTGSIGQPRITLLRPVCGADPFDEETLGSTLRLTYPDYAVIFCAPHESDPAVPLVRRLLRDHPQIDARLMIGLDAVTGNPKLNNLFKGWQAATTEWICMADSNLLLPPDYLDRIVAAWGPNTGLVSAPPIGTRPAGFAGHLECAFLNSNQARLQFASDSMGQGFAQGKTLFWNRETLDKAGGIVALGGNLAEDVAATKVTRASGKVVSLTRLPCAQPIGRRSLRQVWDRQLRWSRVRRDGFPHLFAAEFANGAVLPAVLCLAGLLSLGWSPWLLFGFLGLWYSAEVVLMRGAGWPAKAADIAALPVRDLMLPVLWAATFLRRDIEWRGNAMKAPRDLTQVSVSGEALPLTVR